MTIQTWQARIAERRPTSEAQYWPVELKCKYMEAEIADLRAQQAEAAPAPNARDMTAMVDAAMTEMSNFHPPLCRKECERLIRAALARPAPPDTTEQLAGAVWNGPNTASQVHPNMARPHIPTPKE